MKLFLTVALLFALCNVSSAYVFSSYRVEFYNQVIVGENNVLPLARNPDGSLISFDSGVCNSEMYWNSLRVFQPTPDELVLVFCGSDGSLNVLNEVSKATAASSAKGADSRWIVDEHESDTPDETASGFFSTFWGDVQGRDTLCTNKLGSSYRLPLSAEYALYTLPEVQALSVIGGGQSVLLKAAERGSPLAIEKSPLGDGSSVLSIQQGQFFHYDIANELHTSDVDRTHPSLVTATCANIDNEFRLIARKTYKNLDGSRSLVSDYKTSVAEEGDRVQASDKLGLDYIKDPYLASIDQINYGIDGSRYEQEFFFPGNMHGYDKDTQCREQLGRGWSAATLAELQHAISSGFNPASPTTFDRYNGPQSCGSVLNSALNNKGDAFVGSETAQASRWAHYCQYPSIVVRDTCATVTPLAYDFTCDLSDLPSAVSPVPDAERSVCQPILARTRDAERRCRTEEYCSDACVAIGDETPGAGNTGSRCVFDNAEELPWTLTDLRPDWYLDGGNGLTDYPRFEDGDNVNRGLLACAYRPRGGAGGDRRGRTQEELDCRSPRACHRRDTTDDQWDSFPVNDILVQRLGKEESITLEFSPVDVPQLLRLPNNLGITTFGEAGASVVSGSCSSEIDSACVSSCLPSSCKNEAIIEYPGNFVDVQNEHAKIAGAGRLATDVTDIGAVTELYDPKIVRLPVRFLTNGEGSTTMLSIEAAEGFFETDNNVRFWLTGCGSTDDCAQTSTPNPAFAGYEVHYNSEENKYDFTLPRQVFGEESPVGQYVSVAGKFDCDLFLVVGFENPLLANGENPDDRYTVTISGMIDEYVQNF